jgi:MoxR-like ATPase
LSLSHDGQMTINGTEVRYVPAASLVPRGSLKYVDTLGLLPLIHQMSVDRVSGRNDPVNMLFSGPKGIGKTLLVSAFAAANDLPLIEIQGSEEARDRLLRGGFTSKDGNTPFILGQLTNAINVANERGVCGVLIEEINAFSSQVQKMLNSFLDWRRSVEVPEIGYTFTLKPGAHLFVWATMNPTIYGGTYDLNEDLKSRFVEIEMDYPPPASEKTILREMTKEYFGPGIGLEDRILDMLVNIARETRQTATSYALSTRDLVVAIQMLPRVGLPMTLFLLSQKFSDKDRRLILNRITDITGQRVFGTLFEMMSNRQEMP